MKRKDQPSQSPSFLFPKNVSGDQESPATLSMIMKSKEKIKYFLKFQQKKQSDYNKQVLKYQYIYNTKHEKNHIWRHSIYKRTIYFFLDGERVSVQIEIVRFRYAKSPNTTFTFYGTLFCGRCHYSSEYIKNVIFSKTDPFHSPASNYVSVRTIIRWKTIVFNHTYSIDSSHPIRP